MATTYTAHEAMDLYREKQPGTNPVAAEHDDRAAFADGEPWFVWLDSEESEPERIILPYKE